MLDIKITVLFIGLLQYREVILMGKKGISDGDKLKTMMKDLGWKQIDLARNTGIPPVQINRWVNSSHLDTGAINIIMESMNKELWEFFISKKEIAELCNITPVMLDIARLIEKLPNDFQEKILNIIDSVLDGFAHLLKSKRR